MLIFAFLFTMHMEKASWRHVACHPTLTSKWAFNSLISATMENSRWLMKLRWRDCSAKGELKQSDHARSKVQLGWNQWKTNRLVSVNACDCWMKRASDIKSVIKTQCAVAVLIVTYSVFMLCQNILKSIRPSWKRFSVNHGNFRLPKHRTAKHQKWTWRKIPTASARVAGSAQCHKTGTAFLTSLQAKTWYSSTYRVRAVVRRQVLKSLRKKSAGRSTTSSFFLSNTKLTKKKASWTVPQISAILNKLLLLRTNID